MHRNKPHKGLLKRVRISKTGKVRHRTAGHQHLRSHKTGSKLRQMRMDTVLPDSEAKRFEKLLYRRLRGRTQPLSAARKSPTPEERRSKQAAAREAAQNAN